MMLNDLHERLTQVFIDLFAANVFDFHDGFKGGGPNYYGVRVENLATNGPELDLVLTFRAGNRYCCFEFADHFAFYSNRGWSRLRKCMDSHGLDQLPLPTIRKLHAVIEKGAVMTPSPKVPLCIWEGSAYQAGPFVPVAPNGDKPTSITTGGSRG